MNLLISTFDTGFLVVQKTFLYGIPSKKKKEKIYDQYSQFNYQLSKDFYESNVYSVKLVAEFDNIESADSGIGLLNYYSVFAKNSKEFNFGSISINGVITEGNKIKMHTKGGKIVVVCEFKILETYATK